jgi:hypothetical protein
MDTVLRNMLADYIENSSKQIDNLTKLNLALTREVAQLKLDHELINRRLKNLEAQHI